MQITTNDDVRNPPRPYSFNEMALLAGLYYSNQNKELIFLSTGESVDTVYVILTRLKLVHVAKMRGWTSGENVFYKYEEGEKEITIIS